MRKTAIVILVFVLFASFASSECPAAGELKGEIRKALFDYLKNPQKSALTGQEMNSVVSLYVNQPIWASDPVNYCNKPYTQYPGINFSIVFEKIENKIPDTVVPRCRDGTLYGDCSRNKPLLCAAGRLVDDCENCLCASGSCNVETGCCGESLIQCKGQYKQCGLNTTIPYGNPKKKCICEGSLRSSGSCCDGAYNPSPSCGVYSGGSCQTDYDCQGGYPTGMGYTCMNMMQIGIRNWTVRCNRDSSGYGYCLPNISIVPYQSCSTPSRCVEGIPVCVKTSPSFTISTLPMNTGPGNFIVSGTVSGTDIASVTIMEYLNEGRLNTGMNRILPVTCPSHTSCAFSIPRNFTYPAISSVRYIAYATNSDGLATASNEVFYSVLPSG